MELVLIVGPPGSGKSTLANSYTNGSYIVNQDRQGKDCFETIFKPLLTAKSKIIVDRMNFSKEQRQRYLEPAKNAGYKTKIIVLHENFDTC